MPVWNETVTKLLRTGLAFTWYRHEKTWNRDANRNDYIRNKIKSVSGEQLHCFVPVSYEQGALISPIAHKKTRTKSLYHHGNLTSQSQVEYFVHPVHHLRSLVLQFDLRALNMSFLEHQSSAGNATKKYLFAIFLLYSYLLLYQRSGSNARSIIQ